MRVCLIFAQYWAYEQMDVCAGVGLWECTTATFANRIESKDTHKTQNKLNEFNKEIPSERRG